MKAGGAGVITTIGNVAPERMKEIVELCADGKFEEALKAHEALLPLMDGFSKPRTRFWSRRPSSFAVFPSAA